MIDLQDNLNNRAEEYAEYFATVPEEQHIELADLVAKQAVQQAKADHFAQNLEGEIDTALEQGDYDTAAELAKYNTDKHETYQKQIDNMVDDANGIVEIKDIPEKSKKIPKSVRGDEVLYSFERGNPRFLDNPDEQYQQIFDSANEVARQYGMRDPKNMISIEWDVAPSKEDQKMDDIFKRKAALNALSTWRKKVLPKLPAGVILYNTPTNDVRERLYKLAGFSPAVNEFKGNQFGIVVEDENGSKRVVPFDPSGQIQESIHWKVQQIEDYLLDVIAEDNVYYSINTVYEGLFG